MAPDEDEPPFTFESLSDSFDQAIARREAPIAPAAQKRIETRIVSTGFENQRQNKINQLGMGPLIIDMKKEGHSLTSIAKSLRIGEEQVTQWWKTYSSLSPGQRKAFLELVEKNNIWDVKTQLQRIFDKMETAANRVAEENPALLSKILVDQANMLKQATALAEMMANHERDRQEKQAFIQEIQKAASATCPKCKHDFISPVATNIQRRLKEMREAKGLI